MNVTKSIAIVAAMLITAAGMSGIANYSNAAADAIRARTHASVTVVPTLPTITVRPTAEQLRELRREAGQGGTTAVTAESRMPYYSFGSDEAGA